MNNKTTLGFCIFLLIINISQATSSVQHYESFYLTTHFGDDWDNIAKKIAKSPEDELMIAEGAKIVRNLDNFAPHLAKETQADLLFKVGKSSEALKFGDNAVKEIRFVEPTDKLLDGAEASFYSDNIIRISKSAKITDVKRILIPHEMAHAKIVESVSPEINKLLDKKNLEQFDEFLADNLAKSKVGAYYLDELAHYKYVGYVGIVYDDFAKSNKLDVFAKDVALAKKYDSVKYKWFTDFLNAEPEGDKIIKLSDLFVENADHTKLDSAILDIISKKVDSLRGLS